MKRYGCRCSLIICFILIITFLTSHLPLGSTPFLQEVTAEHKEFEVNKFDENLSILPNGLQAIDLNLQKGEKIEVVFTLQVKEGLPVDVWFVNEDHYLLLKSGAQFLYFIDGSAQEVAYTRKIVTLTEHNLYIQVITNYYNNQTIEVNIVYEIRTYYADSGETSSEDLSIFVYPLFLAVIILVVLIIVLLFKTRDYKQTISNISEKTSVKKGKKHKLKKVKPRVSEKANVKNAKVRKHKKIEAKVIAEDSFKKPESVIFEQGKRKTSEEVISGFCGYCRKPVTTPYCINCGRKVEIPKT